MTANLQASVGLSREEGKIPQIIKLEAGYTSHVNSFPSFEAMYLGWQEYRGEEHVLLE